MNCPECNARLDIIDTRLTANNATRRRLECPKCGERFSSIEVILEERAAVNLSEVFSQLAKNAVVHGYTSAVTGGIYESKEAAINDSIAELERIYNEQ